MTSPRLLALLFATELCLGPARALAFGVGVELGGTATYASNVPARDDGSSPNSSGTFNLGLILEQNFGFPLITMELWEDIQTPLQLQAGRLGEASYIPIDAGFRAGLALGPFQPYLGLVGQLLILSDGSKSEPVNDTAFGLGGDIGLDIALFFLKFGAEVRGIEVLTAIPKNAAADGTDRPSSAFELQVLGSVRLAF